VKGSDWVVAGLTILGCIGFISMINDLSFARRCTEAGYKAAAHERCVMRASKGGPIYEENTGANHAE